METIRIIMLNGLFLVPIFTSSVEYPSGTVISTIKYLKPDGMTSDDTNETPRDSIFPTAASTSEEVVISSVSDASDDRDGNHVDNIVARREIESEESSNSSTPFLPDEEEENGDNTDNENEEDHVLQDSSALPDAHISKNVEQEAGGSEGVTKSQMGISSGEDDEGDTKDREETNSPLDMAAEKGGSESNSEKDNTGKIDDEDVDGYDMDNSNQEASHISSEDAGDTKTTEDTGAGRGSRVEDQGNNGDVETSDITSEDDELVSVGNEASRAKDDTSTVPSLFENVDVDEGESSENDATVATSQLSASLSDMSSSESSAPLRTLKKLQQMLDSTDYMTTSQYYRSDDVEDDNRQVITASSAQSISDSSLPVINNNYIDESEGWSDHVSDDAMSMIDSDDEFFGHQQVIDAVDLDVSYNANPPAQPPPQKSEPPQPPPQQQDKQEKLWTSKDRSKYKKQQRAQQREAANNMRRTRQLQQSPPIHPNSSDDEHTSDGETEEDGLGYTLPDYPVYMTDDEGVTDGTTEDIEPPPRLMTTQQYQQQQQQQQQQQLRTMQQPPQQQDRFQQYGPNVYNQYPVPPNPSNQRQQQQRTTANYVYPPGLYPPYNPYNTYHPQQQQQQQQQQQLYAAQQQAAAAWAAANAGRTPYGQPPPNQLYPPWSQSYIPPRPSVQSSRQRQYRGFVDEQTKSLTDFDKDESTVFSTESNQLYPVANNVDNVVTLAEAGAKINLESVQRIFVFCLGVMLLCYSAVSPRTLPPVEYNLRFKENLSIVAFVAIAPAINALLVFDAKENDVNTILNTFYQSFTIGYAMAFILQIIVTTFLRLIIFAIWEPDVFKLTPKVPSLVLPWVLREQGYRPKRITLFAADFATSCIACPIIEEYMKLKILQWNANLPKNFKWSTRKASRKKPRRRVSEVIPRGPGEREVTTINSYVSEMLAVSLGMKLCDSVRRILMYTKASNLNKGFYAFCRGIFPIHELCGAMTALELAKRDVLGVDIPLWRMLFPAVFIHGMANFRGKKPLFKWNSATPWAEMQLSPWNVEDDSTFTQLLSKGFAKLMWLIILSRVLGYCVKNYYMINRQAVKRNTLYAGKRAAFAAELAADEMLKKSKKK